MIDKLLNNGYMDLQELADPHQTQQISGDHHLKQASH